MNDSIGTRVLLRQLEIKPSKGLGQNFLVDASVPAKILAAAELKSEDAVIEIGPGVGVLTRLLVQTAAKFTAVELDQRLYPFLREMLSPYLGAKLVEGDVLDFQPKELEPSAYKLIANIPYYITSAILRHFLESSHRPQQIVLMVQKEVAQRIVAKPPEMSLLAVSVQFYGKPKLFATVPAGAFYPPPKVDSAILVIKVYPDAERPCRVTDEARLFEVVRAGFGQKRKQLANSLATGLHLDKEIIREVLAAGHIAAERRAETLSLEEWEQLYNALEGLAISTKAG
ncbi:16S rRNA (adenine(1518)-N(6)/adenine(1519)-N(6))-dimethyltransferase RsmA [Candidatus Chlorohelix sp.]|uniref:16S rRNA (adenine(1518)-N(6)/adenine(1519)-N(6))- dimethyltransferase RsmA n=1 Tax=Candidatus Chlorohelix sp. TaxID=3139201 RepID=UPI0030553AE5